MKGASKMANETLKLYAKSNGICLWQIADHLGINDGNFSRRLRKELPVQQKEAIFKIIEELKRGE
jgi:hypothetical protein